jgi:hypothetical protein
MNGRSIKIKIDPLGNPTVEAVGFNGMDCEAATKGIEDALGGGGERTMKPEAYNEGDDRQENHISW